MSRSSRLALLLLSLGALLSPALALDHAAVKVMPFLADRRACLACHKPNDPRLRDSTLACDRACRGCHKDLERHHSVGQKLEGEEQVQLPLRAGRRTACVTCHDLGIVRFDRRPWKSQSLFARIFRRGSTHKTYFLRTNNSDGRLCKTCH